jgi:hypothetical protein
LIRITLGMVVISFAIDSDYQIKSGICSKPMLKPAEFDTIAGPSTTLESW